MEKVKDILIAGIGGQGTILASRLIATAAMNSGYFVRTAETIGMAQRGGSVVSHIRIGSEHKSSMIPLGTAGLLIAFDANEAVRNSAWLKSDAYCIMNLKAGETRPDNFGSAVYIDGMALAEKAGSVRTQNTVLIGAVTGCGFLCFGKDCMLCKDCMLEVLKKLIPEKYIEINIKAFEYGYHEVTK